MWPQKVTVVQEFWVYHICKDWLKLLFLSHCHQTHHTTDKPDWSMHYPVWLGGKRRKETTVWYWFLWSMDLNDWKTFLEHFTKSLLSTKYKEFQEKIDGYLCVLVHTVVLLQIVTISDANRRNKFISKIHKHIATSLPSK